MNTNQQNSSLARLHLWVLALALCLAPVLSLAQATPAWAATLTVTNTNDSGPGSLRQALADAASGDTITFGVNGTITLTSGELVISKNVTLQGPGTSLLTISGNNAMRVFFINPGAPGAVAGPPTTNLVVNFANLTIANGMAQGNHGGQASIAGGSGGAGGMGGGLFINRGTVSLTNVIFRDNQARGGNGAGGPGSFLGAAGGGGMGSNGGVGGFPGGPGGSGGSLGGGGGSGGAEAASDGAPGGSGGGGGEGAGGGGGGIGGDCALFPTNCTTTGGAGGAGGAGGFGGGGGGGGSSGYDEIGIVIGGNGGAGGFGAGGGGGGGSQRSSGGGAGGSGGSFGGIGGIGQHANSGGGGGGGGGAGLGGALFLRAGTLTLSNSTFTNNIATRGINAFNGASGQGKGGALFIHTGATLSGCVNFSSNTASDAVGTGTDTNDFYGGTVSNCVPTVLSLVRRDPTPTNAGVVVYQITFSENVSGVDVADFGLTSAGPTGARISRINGGGAVYDVIVDSGSGDGTLRLDLVDNDSILDIAGNLLGGVGVGNGNFTGPSYTIDRTSPTVLTIARLNPNPTNASQVDYQVTFSEDVTGVDQGDFRLSVTGLSGASITSVDISPNGARVVVNTGSGAGTLRLDFRDNGTVLDRAGNRFNTPEFQGEVYDVDNRPLSVTINQAAGQADPTTSSPIHFTALFNKPVSGFDFHAAQVSGDAGGRTVAVSEVAPNNGTTYDVAVSGMNRTGTVVVTIPANGVTDAFGNRNLASTSTDNTVTFSFDTTPPVITPNVVGTLGTNGWYVSDVSVSWSVVDNESALSSQTGCDPVNLTTDSAGVILTCTATSIGGTASASVTLKRDATAPTISAAATPAANGAGWNNRAVTVSFTCADEPTGSGIATDSMAGATLSTEGASQSVTNTGICVDNAGNTATAVTVGNINLDTTAPTLTPAVSPNPVAMGSAATVTSGAADVLSGLATESCGALDTSSPGVKSVICTATDNAGNSNSATVNYTVEQPDNVAPTANPSQSPAANANGWNNTDVTVTWNWSDPSTGSEQASGIDNANCTTSSASSGEGTLPLSATCQDLAGNAGSTTYTAKVDKTLPTLDPTVSPNPVAVGGAATVTSGAADTLSGVASQSCGALDTSTAGVKSITCTATDNAGNNNSATVNYTVQGNTGTLIGSCGGYAVYQNGSTYTAAGWSGAIKVGTSGNNTLTGSSGPDLMLGLGGNDLLKGNGGDDVLCGGDGVDLVQGHAGNDYLDGGNQSDVLNGSGGDYDVLLGGDGNDVLLDGDGVSNAAGGAGNDLFTLALRNGWRDANSQARFAGLSGGYGNDAVGLAILNPVSFFVDISGDERDNPASPLEGNNDGLALAGVIDPASTLIKFEHVLVVSADAQSVPSEESGAEFLTEPVGDEENSAENGAGALNNWVFLPVVVK